MATISEDVKKEMIADENFTYDFLGIDVKNIPIKERNIYNMKVTMTIERDTATLQTDLDENVIIKAFDGGKPAELER